MISINYSFSDEDLQETLAAMKKVVDEAIVSKEAAIAFLVELGTHNLDGSLTENYK